MSNLLGVDKTQEFDMIKYHRAASIINEALKMVIEKCVPGASVLEVCEAGENFILEELNKVYTKKGKGDNKVDKGIAFPVTICINEICCNYTPNDSKEIMNKGDLVKINMGCHIDGHIAVVGHTIYIKEDGKEEIIKSKEYILKCTYLLIGLLLKQIKIGNSFSDITKIIEKACNDLNVNILPECFSYQMKKYVLEGSKYINLQNTSEMKMDKHKIEENEMYLLHVSVTDGESKYFKNENKTNIYKRDVTSHYELRTNLGRTFMEEVNKKFPVLPFHLKYIENQRAALIGMPEALRHNLFKPYTVQCVKKNDNVAQFKYTVLVKPDGVKILTGIDCFQLDKQKMQQEFTQDYLTEILQNSIFGKTKQTSNKATVGENGKEGDNKNSTKVKN